jgi:hypothetical protein
MLKNKYIKLFVSSFLILMAVWIAVPKVYVHELLSHDHSVPLKTNGTAVSTQSTDDCDFEKYNKPLYFNIFKFISSFIPLKPQQNISARCVDAGLSGFYYAISLLRGPPAAR